MKRTVIVWLLCFVALFFGCKSQNEKIVGTVRDVFLTPMQGVTVGIEKSKFSSITDNSGNYSLDYAPGQIRVVFSKSGYTTRYLDLNIQQKSYFPAEDIVLYPIPKEKGLFYISQEKKELVNLRQTGIVEEKRKDSKNNFMTKLFSYYVENQEKYPAAVKIGSAMFIDNYPANMRLCSVAKDGLIYAGELNMFERHDKYSGFLDGKAESIGKENLIVRTFDLQKGIYSWVEMTGNNVIGSIPKKDGAALYFKAYGENDKEEDLCVSAEADADAVASAIADYFAIPSHTTLGTVPISIGSKAGHPISGGMSDMKFPTLTGNNTAEIKGSMSEVVISVTDGSRRCPLEYQKSHDGWNGVQGAGVYTKIIK